MVLYLALAAIHMNLQVSHYLLVRELHRTFNEIFQSVAHFCAPLNPLSVQSSNQGFIPCLRVLLCSLTWLGIEPMASSMEVQCLTNQAIISLLYLQTLARSLRILAMHVAKNSKICNFRTFWPVIQLINHHLKI